MQTYPKYAGKTVFVFANTGKEREETLEFVEQCDKAFGLNLVWIEATFSRIDGNGYKIVDFATASRNEEPMQAMMAHYNKIPGTNARTCTTELKITPIHRYMVDTVGRHYLKALGIRADEPKRINRKEKRRIYPLVDVVQVTNGFIRDWWGRQPFDLKLADYEGNCDFCFAKSVRKRMTLSKLYPEMATWWKEMELRYGHGHTFDRESVEDVLEKAKKPFTMSVDGYAGSYQKTLFDPDLDKDVACFCGNTGDE
jgi:hypothetical protein